MTFPILEKRYQPLLWCPVTLRTVREVEDFSFDTVAVSTERRSDSTCTMIVVKADVPFLSLYPTVTEGANPFLELEQSLCDADDLIRFQSPHE